MTKSQVKQQGELAMQIIADDPLYASTCGISYEEAIAVAKVFVPDGNFKGYLDEMERFGNLSEAEMLAELKAEGAH